MSDQDNLRDRIAQVFYRVGNGVLVLDMSPNERNELAQAIIDEFGMTIDRAVDTGNRSHDKRTGIITNGWKYRVVGKWEKR